MHRKFTNLKQTFNTRLGWILVETLHFLVAHQFFKLHKAQRWNIGSRFFFRWRRGWSLFNLSFNLHKLFYSSFSKSSSSLGRAISTINCASSSRRGLVNQIWLLEKAFLDITDWNCFIFLSLYVFLDKLFWLIHENWYEVFYFFRRKLQILLHYTLNWRWVYTLLQAPIIR